MGQRAPGAGRFAPSPSGDLHLGNLRTALLAWLFARSTGRRFLMRIEDLDRVLPGSEQRQLADLAALGVDWDGEIVRQSERLPLHTAAIETLTAAGLTYECFCTRREVQQATFAPHGPDGHYPGTCRDLTDARRQAKRDAGRPPAIRLRAAVAEFTVHDELHGSYCGAVDDVVLRRGDGVPAYNLAVVVDDAAQGVDQVVRGDDLLSSAPRQGYLASLLSLPAPRYAHVSLALNAEGKRLAKRDGAVTLADQRAEGRSPDQVRAALARSLGMAADGELPTMSDLLTRFVPGDLPRKAWIFTEA